MTATTLTVDALLRPLSADVAERLDRIRGHASGLSTDDATQLVAQAFRNFPEADTALLVQHLSNPHLVGE